ncbi:MAG: hypothetical protein WAZ60_13645 [Desulfosalsimonadaceae bacterium]
MKIQIDPHTLKRAGERGTNQSEIVDTIKTGFDISARHGRIAKGKVYNFRRERNGKYYEQKRVEVFYILEESKIITVTIYVFYGKWEVA